MHFLLEVGWGLKWSVGSETCFSGGLWPGEFSLHTEGWKLWKAIGTMVFMLEPRRIWQTSCTKSRALQYRLVLTRGKNGVSQHSQYFAPLPSDILHILDRLPAGIFAGGGCDMWVIASRWFHHTFITVFPLWVPSTQFQCVFHFCCNLSASFYIDRIWYERMSCDWETVELCGGCQRESVRVVMGVGVCVVWCGGGRNFTMLLETYFHRNTFITTSYNGSEGVPILGLS